VAELVGVVGLVDVVGCVAEDEEVAEVDEDRVLNGPRRAREKELNISMGRLDYPYRYWNSCCVSRHDPLSS